MLERDIERQFVKEITKKGGLCEKFTSPNRRGVPDRIVTLPNGKIIFVELKAKGKVPTRLQQLDHDKRRSLGCIVEVIDSPEGVGAFCSKYVK